MDLSLASPMISPRLPCIKSFAIAKPYPRCHYVMHV
jgi:hypothetical protein